MCLVSPLILNIIIITMMMIIQNVLISDICVSAASFNNRCDIQLMPEFCYEHFKVKPPILSTYELNVSFPKDMQNLTHNLTMQTFSFEDCECECNCACKDPISEKTVVINGTGDSYPLRENVVSGCIQYTIITEDETRDMLKSCCISLHHINKGDEGSIWIIKQPDLNLTNTADASVFQVTPIAVAIFVFTTIMIIVLVCYFKWSSLNPNRDEKPRKGSRYLFMYTHNCEPFKEAAQHIKRIFENSKCEVVDPSDYRSEIATDSRWLEKILGDQNHETMVVIIYHEGTFQSQSQLTYFEEPLRMLLDKFFCSLLHQLPSEKTIHICMEKFQPNFPISHSRPAHLYKLPRHWDKMLQDLDLHPGDEKELRKILNQKHSNLLSSCKGGTVCPIGTQL